MVRAPRARPAAHPAAERPAAAQQLHGPADRCRIGLLATTALLLGGDAVELEVEVGPGADPGPGRRRRHRRLRRPRRGRGVAGRGPGGRRRPAALVGGAVRRRGRRRRHPQRSRSRWPTAARRCSARRWCWAGPGSRAGGCATVTTAARGGRPVLVEDTSWTRTATAGCPACSAASGCWTASSPSAPSWRPRPGAAARPSEPPASLWSSRAAACGRALLPDLAASPLHPGGRGPAEGAELAVETRAELGVGDGAASRPRLPSRPRSGLPDSGSRSAPAAWAVGGRRGRRRLDGRRVGRSRLTRWDSDGRARTRAGVGTGRPGGALRLDLADCGALAARERAGRWPARPR